MTKAYAFVYITDIAYSIDKKYTYFIPYDLRDEIKIGSVVVVPFGNANKRKSAVVVGFAEECEYPRIKHIDKIMHYPFDVPEELIYTCSFMKERFFCTFGNAFKTVIPPSVNLSTETVYRVNEDRDLSRLNDAGEICVRKIQEKGIATERELINEYGEECKRLLDALCRSEILFKETRVPEKLNEKNLYTYSLAISNEEAAILAESGEGLTEKQRGLTGMLINYPAVTVREIEELGGYTASIVNALVKKGIAERRETAVFREAYSFDDVEPEGDYTLSEEQQKTVEGITELLKSGEPKGALLFGVTGSGKTRVIIETVKEVLKNGKQAIILLPEIGLASQAVKSYAAAFGKRLAVIHSMLSVGERTDTYRKILEGNIDVVIGTRSAIFAPLTRLGIIAIDEEQAHTYKSEMQPKYNAIDIARFRCTNSNALMLLASATPSIESYYKAQKGNYSLFKLENRFGEAKLPKVIIEDLRDDETVAGGKLIGKRLTKELLLAKSENKQALLFVNRRGYNSHISCRECGYVFNCPNCSVSLTHHVFEGIFRSTQRMSCHYCGFTSILPEICPVCGGKHISYSGFGTQKLQEELEKDFPNINVIRMDSDTTGSKYSHEKIIDSFAKGKNDILLGTQMISKGLDFPGVKIAGAVSIDSALYMDDFRAGERTFSLVTQLVGRAGRAGDDSYAVLQTYNPDNEILNLAATQNYEKFYESEIQLRKAVVFPPFCSMAVFGISSAEESECEEFAKRFNLSLLSLYDKGYKGKIKVIKFGPYKSGIYKVMGKYRHRIIIKYKDDALARQFFNELLIEGLNTAPKGVKVDLDVNPAII
ncbi:MAG: primosomal protein N' [Clostridia bacterium]|nr:primosomal protein N' [Clostridia bacterium]